MKRLAFTFLVAAAGSASWAQWGDFQRLGNGGEAFISTDGKGHVYATSHIPCKLYVSSDFGRSFDKFHDLPDAFCDVTSAVGPDGRLYVIYIQPNVQGLQVMISGDNGKTLEKGGVIKGPYDREWIVVNPVTGDIGYDYSDGYIGGPDSKGVFYAASTDKGKSFSTVSRIDKEPAGSFPVDPYLTVGTGGRLYAAWAVTRDKNRIFSYMVATSDDNGKTWANHTQMAVTHSDLGDTQERWMLGSIVAIGKDTVMAIYQDYASMNVVGNTVKPLLAYYRVSTDGGRTWSRAQTCLSEEENRMAVQDFLLKRSTVSTVPNYMQALPWVTCDPNGRVHLAFVDNRSGQTEVGGKKYGLWQVRYSTWSQGAAAFTKSERVSHDWTAERPPLDFIGVTADAENAWVIWTENPGHTAGWDFSGELYVAHKKTSPVSSLPMGTGPRWRMTPGSNLATR